MSSRFENYGLIPVTLKEEGRTELAEQMKKDGKEVVGYYGLPYYFKSLGLFEIWVRTGKTGGGTIEAVGIDTHCAGSCVWKLRCCGLELTNDGHSKLERIPMLTNNGKDFIPVDIINADVLPSFLKGEEVRLQVVAQPTAIYYFDGEEAYSRAQQEQVEGLEIALHDGNLRPLWFCYNHRNDGPGPGNFGHLDRLVSFRATVKKVLYGTCNSGTEQMKTFLRVLADTEFGELQFDHTLYQVPEELRENIRPGAIIAGECLISADAAIDGYEDGVVRNFRNDLRALMYTLERGEAVRLRPILAENCVYESEASKVTVQGPDKVISRLGFVQADNHNHPYRVIPAVITESGTSEHPQGSECLALVHGGIPVIESILFISVDEEGRIERIHVTEDLGYRFHIDEQEMEFRDFPKLVCCDRALGFFFADKENNTETRQGFLPISVIVGYLKTHYRPDTENAELPPFTDVEGQIFLDVGCAGVAAAAETGPHRKEGNLSCQNPKTEPPAQSDRASFHAALDALSTGESFGKMLQKLIIRSGLDNPEFQKKANMSRATFSSIIGGKTKPNKNTVFSCIMALELALPEAEELLQSAGYAFSSAGLADLIVKCFVENGVYNLDELNGVLVDAYDLPALGSKSR